MLKKKKSENQPNAQHGENPGTGYSGENKPSRAVDIVAHELQKASYGRCQLHQLWDSRIPRSTTRAAARQPLREGTWGPEGERRLGRLGRRRAGRGLLLDGTWCSLRWCLFLKTERAILVCLGGEAAGSSAAEGLGGWEVGWGPSPGFLTCNWRARKPPVLGRWPSTLPALSGGFWEGHVS